MSKAQQSKIREQLGMWYGTAKFRLTKMLLFHFAQKLGLGNCYRCKKKMLIDDFTIEHKEPWTDVDPALFWDLDNVAFSHLGCNSGAARQSKEKNRNLLVNKKTHNVTAPAGTAWCAGHKNYLPIGKFHRDSSRTLGVQKYCKECRRSKG